jgi:tellurite resistance protein
MFIIYGSRGVTQVTGSAEFTCPQCGDAPQRYLRKSVQRYFHLFFIPVFPTGQAAEYIECQRCGGTFDVQVLTRYPAERRVRNRAEFVEYVKRIMIFTALADGRVDDAEGDAIREIYAGLSGTPLSRSDLERELYLGRLAKKGLANYARRFPGSLSEDMKEEAIKAVLTVANADGAVGQDERQLLSELAAEMGLAEGRFRQLVPEPTEFGPGRGVGADPPESDSGTDAPSAR